MELNQDQKSVIEKAAHHSVFLSGTAGTGKTSCAKAFITELLEQSVPGNKILVFVPQKSLGLTYKDSFADIQVFNGNLPDIQTLSAISQKTIRLFWPLIANQFNFSDPTVAPTFLNIESSQYFLAKITEPFFQKKFFSTIKSEKPRILSQILDNLNKSSLVGIPIKEISNTLKSAWNKDSKHLIAYDEAQICAEAFRNYCYEHNLLDYSLQIEIFNQIINSSHVIQQYLFNSYDYLIYDNCEEDTPAAHDLILQWLPHFTSCLIINDDEAGFRSFLGADAVSASRLADQCQEKITFGRSIKTLTKIQTLQKIYHSALKHDKINQIPEKVFDHLELHNSRFYPQMIDLVVEKVEQCLNAGFKPGEIAILAPFVSNTLLFQIQNRLDNKNIQLVSHRPSRSLREESTTYSLLTWIKIAYPEFEMQPSIYEIRNAFTQSIGNFDPVRADLLARMVYAKNLQIPLRDFGDLDPNYAERISMQALMQYRRIYNWIINFQEMKSEPYVFLASFFGEVISQPGFGFHNNYVLAEITGKLIESMQNFKTNTQSHFRQTQNNWAIDYIHMLENGLISALYIQTWEQPPEDAVYLAPAYTFLMQNRPVKVQFWLDIGNLGWWQRIMQPLTQPYVLSRNWQPGMKWTDTHEYENNQKNLLNVITGLLNRCEEKVLLFTSGYNESGSEQAGPLLQATQKILRARFQQERGINV